MELNREQIVKALECWESGNACEGSRCELFDISPDTCDRWIGRNALSLIKELNGENERLKVENETLKVATNDQYAHICHCHDNIAEMLRQKEAYTVMKMHSMLCEGRVSNDTVVIVANQIAKEMLEDVK